MSCGSCGVVARLGIQGQDAKRLIELGIIPGVKICMLRTAPLGDPLLIELRGYRLSIRKKTAELIVMEV